MNQITYIFLFLLLSAFVYGQVGIGNKSPKGILDINLPNGKNVMGLVLPVVEKVDVDSIYTSINAEGEGTPNSLKVIPSVTTFDNEFQTITITKATENGAEKEIIKVPVDEAPEGTMVYDKSRGCVRYKKSDKIGDWTGCLADKQEVSNEINYNFYGGQDFRILKGSAGYYFSLAIGAEDKAVYSAGSGNAYGTGQGRTGNASWTNILGQPAKEVSAGYRYGAAVLENGELWTWGYNYYGQNCQGQRSGYTMTPKKVFMPTNSPVTKVQTGQFNMLILTEDGKVYACGRNNFGINGNGTVSNSELRTPMQIGALNGKPVTDISLGYNSAAAIVDGQIYVWGQNSYSRLGHSVGGNITVPVLADRLSSINNFEKVSIGSRNGIAVTKENKLYVWGTRALGSTSITANPTPQLTSLMLNPGEDIIDIEASSRFSSNQSFASAMVVTNTRVFAVGGNYPRNNQYGKLGLIDDTNGYSVTYQNGVFKEIQNHAIIPGAQFTGASIGYDHSIITTGNNISLIPRENYIGYGSGRANYFQQGTATDRRFFMQLKK